MLTTMGMAWSRVLVVDDDKDVRELVETILRNAGFAVTSVADGAAALAIIERQAVIWPSSTCGCRAGSTDSKPSGEQEPGTLTSKPSLFRGSSRCQAVAILIGMILCPSRFPAGNS